MILTVKELHEKINGIAALIMLAIVADFIFSALIVAFVVKYSTG